MGVYTRLMAVEVGIKELRDNFRSYLQRVKDGEELHLTERGRLVARLGPYGRPSKREELIAQGVLHLPTNPWDPALIENLFQVDAQLSDLVSRDRDGYD